MFSLQTPARSSALLLITFQSFGQPVNLRIPHNTTKLCITERLNTHVAGSWGSRFNISFTTRRCLRRRCCQSIPITREYSGVAVWQAEIDECPLLPRKRRKSGHGVVRVGPKGDIEFALRICSVVVLQCCSGVYP